MGKRDVCLRDKLLDTVRHLRDIADAVVDIIHLSAAGEFPLDCLPHHFVIVLHNISLDWHPVHGRLFQNAHIPDSDQGHVERPWDRRRRERQYIHILSQLLDLFLMGHTKPLLLVNDKKSQIFIPDVLRQYPVGADDDVHKPFLQILYRLLLLV